MNIISKTHSKASGHEPNDIKETDFRNSVVRYEISRFEIEQSFTERIVYDLRIDKSNPLVYAGPGNVVFFVSGYDNDPREIYEIPEFVAFILKANEAGPCWMYFAAPESLWLQTVAFCALKNSHVSGSRPGYRTLAFSICEAVGFLNSQLDDYGRLCDIAKVPKKELQKHLELAFEGFGIKLP